MGTGHLGINTGSRSLWAAFGHKKEWMNTRLCLTLTNHVNLCLGKIRPMISVLYAKKKLFYFFFGLHHFLNHAVRTVWKSDYIY